MKTSVSQEQPSSLLSFSNKAFIVKHLLKRFVEKYFFFSSFSQLNLFIILMLHFRIRKMKLNSCSSKKKT